MNNCHLWILKIYQVDIRNIHYPWYIDGIRKIYTKIYAIVYYVVCTVLVYTFYLTSGKNELPSQIRRPEKKGKGNAE